MFFTPATRSSPPCILVQGWILQKTVETAMTQGPGLTFPRVRLFYCVCVYSSSMILVPLHTFALNSYVDMFQGLASSEWTRNRRSGTPSRRFPLSQCQTRPLVCTWVLPCGGKTWADSRKVMGHQVFKSIA